MAKAAAGEPLLDPPQRPARYGWHQRGPRPWNLMGQRHEPKLGSVVGSAVGTKHLLECPRDPLPPARAHLHLRHTGNSTRREDRVPGIAEQAPCRPRLAGFAAYLRLAAGGGLRGPCRDGSGAARNPAARRGGIAKADHGRFHPLSDSPGRCPRCGFHPGDRALCDGRPFSRRTRLRGIGETRVSDLASAAPRRVHRSQGACGGFRQSLLALGGENGCRLSRPWHARHPPRGGRSREVRRNRGARIRTGDLRHPKAARYQAAPHPD